MTDSKTASSITAIRDIISEARNGRMVILVDSEDDGSVGNLMIPAQMTTPASINFMATVGRGLVSLAITPSHADFFGLSQIDPRGSSSGQERFTVSIEAREGVTTGISANDRARTVAAAIDFTTGRDGLTTPGHVFPIIASAGGVLERARRAEAAVDIAKLAGFNASGVICEILDAEGNVMRLPDIYDLAKEHGLKIGTIRDLVSYRREYDHDVEKVTETDFESRFGGHWRLMVYRNRASGSETLVLVKGQIAASSEPILVRMHQHSYLADSLGAIGNRAGLLEAAMVQIAEAGKGVIVLINKYSSTYYSDTMLARVAGRAPIETTDFRDYGGGAQILAELGLKEIILLSNRHTSSMALVEYGLKIVGVNTIDLPQ
ncbi:3,4-dihydroxy-2-butanone-4-phosphate synthase [Sphingobium phenoxybenzoativorans]|uniref:3,4-dihydroxy-2-butanone-4-phosphate synthase n=1 Tax=Sphingobium phenoxybenzoativorans TaxID=1592790 RepID=UPI0008723D1B|nr:3,4-dihydroxy-2-butanone-4-phosphate synthase [Sphingobium phenoxybenzoativorans]